MLITAFISFNTYPIIIFCMSALDANYTTITHGSIALSSGLMDRRFFGPVSKGRQCAGGVLHTGIQMEEGRFYGELMNDWMDALDGWMVWSLVVKN